MTLEERIALLEGRLAVAEARIAQLEAAGRSYGHGPSFPTYPSQPFPKYPWESPIWFGTGMGVSIAADTSALPQNA
jgi:hypothetical protein